MGRAAAILTVKPGIFDKFSDPAQILTNDDLAYMVFGMAILRPVTPLDVVITHDSFPSFLFRSKILWISIPYEMKIKTPDRD